MERKADRFFHNLKELKTNKDFCDLRVLVEQREFMVHRVVLAAFSGYFRAACSSDMKEKRECRISIRNLSVEQVETVIDYIYGSWQFPFTSSIRAVLRVAEAANYLDIVCLIEYCCDYLLSHYQPLLLLNYYNTFESFNMEKVLWILNDYVSHNFEYVMLKCPKFLQTIKPSDFKRILAQDDLVIKSEDSLFKIICDWLNFQSVKIHKQEVVDILLQIRPGILTNNFESYFKMLRKYGKTEWRDDIPKSTIEMYQGIQLGRILSKESTASLAFQSRSPHQCFLIVTKVEMTLIEPRTERIITFPLEFRKPFNKASKMQSTYGNECLFISMDDRFSLIDTNTMKMYSLPNLSVRMTGFRLVIMRNKLYVIGGVKYVGGSYPNDYVTSGVIYVFDLKCMRWEEFDLKLPSARYGCSAVAYNERIYLAGGRHYGREDILVDFYCLDIENRQWIRLPDLPKAQFHKLVESNGKIYVIKDQNSIMSFDSATHEWSALNEGVNQLGSRSHFKNCCAMNSHIYCFTVHYGSSGIWRFENSSYKPVLRNNREEFKKALREIENVFPLAINLDSLTGKNMPSEL